MGKEAAAIQYEFHHISDLRESPLIPSPHFSSYSCHPERIHPGNLHIISYVGWMSEGSSKFKTDFNSLLF
jgi:hypothetical protein